MAKDEMKKVFGRKPRLKPDSEIPPRSEEEEDFEWLIRRNLILMTRYLQSQIDAHAEPERIRADLIAVDRFLNTYLLSLDLDAEDACSELTDYFEESLMKLEPLPPFTPLFGSFARFYSWLKEEPSLIHKTNAEGFTVPRACDRLLLSLKGDIPYLTRLYEIASDPANDRPGSASGSKDMSGASPAEVRLSNWREDQRDQNEEIVARFRQELREHSGWSRDEIQHAVRVADLYLIDTLPMLLLRADQCEYDLRTTFLRTRRIMAGSGRTDFEDFSRSFSALLDTLTDQGLLPTKSIENLPNPYYPRILDRTDAEVESLVPSWPMNQAPDAYEDNLNWLRWVIGRNERFLLAFQSDLEDSGMSADRITEHVSNVQELMGEMLDHEGRIMETMPEGMSNLLDRHLNYCDFMTDPESLRRSVASLRRFYRSMVKQDYLSKDLGDDLLSYLKEQTRSWMESI